MKKFAALVTAGAIAAATFVVATPASASTGSETNTATVVEFTPSEVQTALDEFRSAGLLESQEHTSSGEVVSTIDVGGGAHIKLIQPTGRESRLWGGRDKNGVYVSFTNTDQAIIMGGGAWMLTAGLCAVLGAPTAGIGCGVATAVMVIVSGFVTSNGGSCPAGKELRVWVTNTGARNPRCV